ncbi:MAG: ABC transporter substrate-binding protein [Hyphomicrobiales bacterium]|nr:ABC transporter substrate-binding protein [Hyphomicrobiales bacterium]MDE2373754.1 ABC transporter substrate-binding protein [Hyphomicrobiales bacterium]
MLRARNWFGVAAVLGALATQAAAQEPVRIGIGSGLAFLPAYICDDLNLIEKYGKQAHLDLKATFPRFASAGPLRDALAAGTIDIAPLGVEPLLSDWEKASGSPRQLLAISGMTTLSPVLLTNRANVRTLADFGKDDRIAIPAATSPQHYFLQMQSEKLFGKYDKLRSRIVVLSHPQATRELLEEGGPLAGYFSSAPYAEIALADGRIHKVLSGSDVIGGKASFLILAASKSYVAAHPGVAEAVAKAMDEAARAIHDDPRHAAEVFLVHEPSKTLDVDAVAAIIGDIKDEFGSAVHGVQVFADFMGRHGGLKAPPKSWKDIVAPSLLNSPSS